MDLFKQYTVKVLDSWTALRLGLNQESGGPNTQQKIKTLYEYLPQVVSKSKYDDEICDFLEDYLDDELNIICEDNSYEEVAHLLFEAIQLVRSKNTTELQNKISNLTTGCDLKQCEGKIVAAEEVEVDEEMEGSSGTESESEGEDVIDME
uniref:Pre-rRNA-processing protein TSR2 homolog n=1 Tax=Trichobilharzia regenti TaxID=157069 RepID=A0AA85KJF7_TRIRE|nr:unnamed protein product [Trichobilharzia regenti]